MSKDTSAPLRPQHEDVLTKACEVYRSTLDNEQQNAIYSHTKGAVGKRNVLVVAVAFDTSDELMDSVRRTVALWHDEYKNTPKVKT